MIYQQCGSLCPQTCDADEEVECSSGCVEGCFCPSGQFTSYGFCLRSTDCEGINYIANVLFLIIYTT